MGTRRPGRSAEGLSQEVPTMIARHWWGWTEIENADAYKSLLKDKVLRALRGIEGRRGGYILRSDGLREVEFLIIKLFESLDAVKRFAGPGYTVPIFEPEAKCSYAGPTGSRCPMRSAPARL